MKLFFLILVVFSSCQQNKPAHKTKDELYKEELNGGIGSTSDSGATSSGYSTASNKIRVISYNVLKFGDGCQGDNKSMESYLESIIHYTSPDLLGLVKVGSFKLSPNDETADGSYEFPGEVLSNSLNKAFKDRYAYCPTTNIAQGNNMNLLFYDKNKFGFSSVVNLCNSETDFDLFKLYLKGHSKQDSLFLYVILNHTKSGDKSSKRDDQMTCIEDALKKQFQKLPNVIDMGDFNLHSTDEPGYQALVNSQDKNFRFYDPPFAIDKKLTYPANWLDNPDNYSAYLTTSTRKDKGSPNDCGTGGGAKLWFDHILLSSSLTSSSDEIHYVPGSYHTIGNDGKRLNISVNDPDTPNKSVPAGIADALYNFSNKYPVTLELEMK